VALDSGTRLGQGHHGFAIEDEVGTGFQALPVNALLRATGDFLPPELILDAQVSASLTDELVTDADATGTVTPGDTLRYTATITNAGTDDAPIARFEAAADSATAVVAGSVFTSRGSVERAGDPFVEVGLGSLPAGGAATIRYDVEIPDPFGMAPGSLVSRAVVSGQGFHAVVADDPDAPGSADPTVTPVLERTPSFGRDARLRPTIQLSFDRVGKDRIRLKLRGWEVAEGLDPVGQRVAVDVGGVVLDATLDERGRFKAVNDSLKVRARRDGSWKLHMRRRSGDWATSFADEGLDAGSHRKLPVEVGIRATVAGETYESTPELSYSSKAGVRGKARISR
jgi:uncharacterized repeat protein (TIGR01451 family)